MQWVPATHPCDAVPQDVDDSALLTVLWSKTRKPSRQTRAC